MSLCINHCVSTTHYKKAYLTNIDSCNKTYKNIDERNSRGNKNVEYHSMYMDWKTWYFNMFILP